MNSYAEIVRLTRIYIYICMYREREIDTWDQIGISIYLHLPVWPLIERERPSGMGSVLPRMVTTCAATSLDFLLSWEYVGTRSMTLALLGCYFWFLSHQQFPMVSPVHCWLEVRPGMELLEIAEMVWGTWKVQGCKGLSRYGFVKFLHCFCSDVFQQMVKLWNLSS